MEEWGPARYSSAQGTGWPRPPPSPTSTGSGPPRLGETGQATHLWAARYSRDQSITFSSVWRNWAAHSSPSVARAATPGPALARGRNT